MDKNDLSILLERDLKICEAMSKWIETARKFGGDAYGPNWYPTTPDIMKSRLFWRIRTGKDPLPEPPPRAYSCPWYEVVEDPGPHFCLEVHLDSWIEGKALISQCCYDIVERIDKFTAIVQFNSIKYRVSLIDTPESYKQNWKEEKAWFIQRIKSE